MVWTVAAVFIVFGCVLFGWRALVEYLCTTRGHRWVDTPAGWYCRRCGHGHEFGDRM